MAKGRNVCSPVISAPKAKSPLPTCIGVVALDAFRVGLYRRTMLWRSIASGSDPVTSRVEWNSTATAYRAAVKEIIGRMFQRNPPQPPLGIAFINGGALAFFRRPVISKRR